MSGYLRLELPFYSPEAVHECLSGFLQPGSFTSFDAGQMDDPEFCEALNQALKRSIEQHDSRP